MFHLSKITIKLQKVFFWKLRFCKQIRLSNDRCKTNVISVFCIDSCKLFETKMQASPLCTNPELQFLYVREKSAFLTGDAPIVNKTSFY